MWIWEWVGVEVWALMKVRVPVVDVGLGEWRLGSQNSVVVESRGMAITRVLSVWVGLMVVVSVQACILLLDPR